MREKLKFQDKKNLIKSQAPTFEEFYKQVEGLSPIPKISKITETNGSYKVDSMCYVSKKHISRIQNIVGHEDIVPVLKDCQWAYYHCKYTNSQVGFAQIEDGVFVIFYNTHNTFT